MFEHLKKYSKIAVLGPFRSGTRITSNIIAADTGYEILEEQHLRFHEKMAAAILRDYPDNLVIQFPISRIGFLHEFKIPGVLFVITQRNVEDIIKSRIRIYDKREKNFIEKDILEDYQKLDDFRKDVISITVNYPDDLLGHPLWLEDEKRKNFSAYQYQENHPVFDGNKNTLRLKKTLEKMGTTLDKFF